MKVKKENWEEFIIGKNGKTIVRCQAKIRRSNPPRQCSQKAMKGRLMCVKHNRKEDGNRKEVAVMRRNMGLYEVGKDKAMQKELKEVKGYDEKQLADTSDELSLAVALLRRYLKENTDLKIARKPGQLMWLISNVMNFKRIHWEIKHADKVTYTKEQVDYLFIKIRNILTTVIKDTDLLQEIADKIKMMGVELRDDGFKVL